MTEMPIRVPQTTKLTPKAADLLSVSRPTVVRLINDRLLPAERIGNRHRMLLDDVLAYRDERRIGQFEALAATAVDVDSDDDPETIRQQLRAARRVVAEGDEPRPPLTDTSEMPAALLNTIRHCVLLGIGHTLCVTAAEPISVARSGVLLLSGDV